MQSSNSRHGHEQLARQQRERRQQWSEHEAELRSLVYLLSLLNGVR